ncbi:MAG: putative quinol monooxygenase [Myxococcota bacterium]
MLVIAGTISIDPAKREEAIQAAIEMMEETRKEPGCISYTFSADLSEPGDFRIFEEWESQQALDAHFEAPHMAKFQGQMGGFGVRGMKVQRYEVASVGPLG